MPYLRDLGVTALWISPVYLNPVEAYHGYHPLDFERVDPSLCSPLLGASEDRETVRRFVEIAHENGLKVMLDLVVNHTAPNHPWLAERPDWFNCPAAASAEDRWMWGLPDLNHDNIDVNVYFTRNALEWIALTGVDAARLDAARHVETRFWDMFKLFAHGLVPDVTLIGEMWDEHPALLAPYQAFHGFDSMFDFPLQAAIADVFARDQPFHRIARPELRPDEPPGVLNQDGAYRNAYHLVTFIGNHDTPRFFHVAGGEDRADEAAARLKLALTFLLTTRGIPQLYYGDELGMDGGPDPDNRRDMPWGWVDRPARSRAAKRARELHRFTRGLIRLRRSCMALRYGILATLYLTPTLYVFLRAFPGDIRIVALNNAPDAVEAVVPLHANPRIPTVGREALPNGLRMVDDLRPDSESRIADGGLLVRVPPRSGAIYRPA
jgi:alpha-amylase